MFRPGLASAALTVAAGLALTLGGSAAAAPGDSADFGRHVAICAQAHLGQREASPALTCAHDGMTMTFATFGGMVRHMQDMHG
ncbi:MAG: hypothetical protein OEW52_03495 [Thermoleophilia bacterium]|nr:hypothetical protein [Thermoleophilia bacterium]MDH4339243.1 hypothetical protein [Thermoleophilia bacterium]MDH5280198.1 hypothetical protein [Thermoleophilia bacterium]